MKLTSLALIGSLTLADGFSASAPVPTSSALTTFADSLSTESEQPPNGEGETQLLSQLQLASKAASNSWWEEHKTMETGTGQFETDTDTRRRLVRPTVKSLPASTWWEEDSQKGGMGFKTYTDKQRTLAEQYSTTVSNEWWERGIKDGPNTFQTYTDTQRFSASQLPLTSSNEWWDQPSIKDASAGTGTFQTFTDKQQAAAWHSGNGI